MTACPPVKRIPTGLPQIGQRLEGGDAALAGGRDDLQAAAGQIAGGEHALEVCPLKRSTARHCLWSMARPDLANNGPVGTSRKMKTASTSSGRSPLGASSG